MSLVLLSPSDRTAVVLVHFQRCITDSGICFNYDEDDRHRIEQAIDNAAELVRWARAQSVLVAHVGFQRDKGRPFRLKGAPLGTMLEQVGAFEAGTAGHDFTEALRPHPGDLVVHGYGISGFVDTSLHDDLSSRGIEHLFLAGITTSMAVESNVRHGVDLGYQVVIVADASVDASSTDHQTALERLRTIATTAIIGA